MTSYAWQPWEDEAGERYENSQDGARCELPEFVVSKLPDCNLSDRGIWRKTDIIPFAEFLAEQKKEEKRMQHFIAGELYKDMHPMDIGVD